MHSLGRASRTCAAFWVCSFGQKAWRTGRSVARMLISDTLVLGMLQDIISKQETETVNYITLDEQVKKLLSAWDVPPSEMPPHMPIIGASLPATLC